ncbi:MAG: glycosyltransferase family 4 protein [Proteobacteria bacterium]|nr:glycosyltransferase family 4 protein [Pseudomonadota bacterium]
MRRRRPALFEGLRIVYDAEALFALREVAEAAVHGRPLTRAAARRRIAAEAALGGTVDRVLAVSRRDAAWFVRAGARDVRIVTHGMAARRDAPGPAHRSGLLFVGALDPGTPNEDGLAWFVDNAMPLLPPDIVLSIVGECRSNRVAALAARNVRLLGRVDDLTPLYDAARVFVAPARYAGGVAAKLIEAATPLRSLPRSWSSRATTRCGGTSKIVRWRARPTSSIPRGSPLRCATRSRSDQRRRRASMTAKSSTIRPARCRASSASISSSR